MYPSRCPFALPIPEHSAVQIHFPFTDTTELSAALICETTREPFWNLRIFRIEPNPPTVEGSLFGGFPRSGEPRLKLVAHPQGTSKGGNSDKTLGMVAISAISRLPRHYNSQVFEHSSSLKAILFALSLIASECFGVASHRKCRRPASCVDASCIDTGCSSTSLEDCLSMCCTIEGSCVTTC